MGLRNDYPYDEALDDIEDFFNRRVKDESSKSQLIELLGKCRPAKRVPFRHIHNEYIKYTNEKKDYAPLSEDDKKMIDDLFHFWG